MFKNLPWKQLKIYILAMRIAFLKPTFAAKVFAISSAISTTLLIIVMRVVVGGILGVGEKITGTGEMAANVGLGLALSYSLAVAVPTMFFVGWVSGYLVALVFNTFATNTALFKVPVDAFKLEN